jgi:hypothetical protein
MGVDIKSRSPIRTAGRIEKNNCHVICPNNGRIGTEFKGLVLLFVVGTNYAI